MDVIYSPPNMTILTSLSWFNDSSLSSRIRRLIDTGLFKDHMTVKQVPSLPPFYGEKNETKQVKQLARVHWSRDLNAGSLAAECGLVTTTLCCWPSANPVSVEINQEAASVGHGFSTKGQQEKIQISKSPLQLLVIEPLAEIRDGVGFTLCTTCRLGYE